MEANDNIMEESIGSSKSTLLSDYVNSRDGCFVNGPNHMQVIFGETIHWSKLAHISFIELSFPKCPITDEAMNKLPPNKRVTEMAFCYCLIPENIKSLSKIAL